MYLKNSCSATGIAQSKLHYESSRKSNLRQFQQRIESYREHQKGMKILPFVPEDPQPKQITAPSQTNISAFIYLVLTEQFRLLLNTDFVLCCCLCYSGYGNGGINKRRSMNGEDRNRIFLI